MRQKNKSMEYKHAKARKCAMQEFQTLAKCEMSSRSMTYMGEKTGDNYGYKYIKSWMH